MSERWSMFCSLPWAPDLLQLLTIQFPVCLKSLHEIEKRGREVDDQQQACKLSNETLRSTCSLSFLLRTKFLLRASRSLLPLLLSPLWPPTLAPSSLSSPSGQMQKRSYLTRAAQAQKKSGPSCLPLTATPLLHLLHTCCTTLIGLCLLRTPLVDSTCLTPIRTSSSLPVHVLILN